MKRIIAGILFLCVIGLTACSAKTDSVDEDVNKPITPEELFPLEILDEQNISDEELIQKLPDGQKILFIRVYGMEGHFSSGFFIDNHGNKVEFDLFSNITPFCREIEDAYSYISKLDTAQGIEYMSLTDLAVCYDNLLKAENRGDSIYVNADEAAMDDAYYDWYGVIDDGKTSPKIVWLLEEDATTPCMHYNRDKHVAKILAILFKYQNSQKE